MHSILSCPRSIRFLLLPVFLLTSATVSHADTLFTSAPATTNVVHRKLVVGTKEAPPFAMKQADGSWQGIGIDLWKEIAHRLKLDYELREMPLAELLDGVAHNKLDAAVAAITITSERERIIDFSEPFYGAGLAIAVPKTGGEMRWQAVARSFLSWDFLKIIVSLTVMLFVAGLLIWLLERKHNEEQFGGKAMHGIGSGFWWSAVTMATVGYGDKAPRTFGGRLVAIVWMFTSICVISSFTASITSVLTVSQFRSMINGVDDLHKLRVGTVEGTTSQDFLKRERITPFPYPSAEAGMQVLAKGGLDAFVYDEPMLKYFANRDGKGKVEVLPHSFALQGYGIALPQQSPLRESINVALLQIITEPGWQDIQLRYLGRRY